MRKVASMAALTVDLTAVLKVAWRVQLMAVKWVERTAESLDVLMAVQMVAETVAQMAVLMVVLLAAQSVDMSVD